MKDLLRKICEDIRIMYEMYPEIKAVTVVTLLAILANSTVAYLFINLIKAPL